MVMERISAELVECDVHTDELLINMGPQHPSTHGVLRLVLRTDGELILDVIPHIGYLHRSAEKLGESLAARQWLPYTDRLDYLASMNMNLGWSLVVEKLLGLEVTPRAACVRVMVAELNRIASHLVAAGCYGLDLGSFTPYMYAFREREKILDLFEAACGARLTYSYIVPGGVTADLPNGWLDRCAAFLDQFDPTIDDLHAVLTSNDIFIRRTAGVGVLDMKTAIDYGCTGPVLRGSGVDWDLRRDGEPWYARMYEGYAFDVIAPVHGHYRNEAAYPAAPRAAVVGDCWHRFFVRMIEVVQSMAIIRQAMDRYRGTDASMGQPIKATQKLPRGEAYLETEAPKGQMGFMVIGNDTKTPHRVRARSSCFCNLSVAPELCRGGLVADVPAVIGSLDLVLGEIDR
ncbi:MAG: NADH-quinone oxidoreductase subunit D [Pirellulales bacterium]|nr:NADH-quinone oxidoreductase subunit D [Pirellulales bacterium]